MKLLGLLAAMLLVVGAAVALGDSDGGGAGGSGRRDPIAVADVRLVSVESCDALVEWFRTTAEQTDPRMLSGMAVGGREMLTVDDSAVSMPASPEAAPGSQRSSTGFSTTNVQERDVDEPDTVKTDGEVLAVAHHDGVRLLDVRGGTPTIVSTVPLEHGAGELLLSGDRLLALTTTWREDPRASQPVSDGDVRIMIAPAGEPVTILTSIDISDIASPRVVDTRELPGAYRSARATGNAARVVLVTYPNVPQPGPAVWEGAGATPERLEQWQTEAIASMALEDWSPNAGDCSSVATTTAPQGLGTTTVLTLDLQGSLADLDRDSVVADAGTVYASTDRLVIATSRWSQSAQPDGMVSTEVHAFDISDPVSTTYVGSGAVPGHLLNQFAVSEHEGNLRIATTEDAPWDPDTGTSQSDSGITVLDPSMQQIGRVDGLGVTERIQAVRYLGDIAYVVTFRQTDPLYAIDLSDPTAPRVAGELKVPGYSAYLHPLDDGSTLLGVGQDATDEGQTLGTKVSTFDVSTLASPRELDSVRIDRASSTVEWDHRAFLWWDATRTAVIPVEVYGDTSSYTGAAAFDVAADGTIVERGRVSHQAFTDPSAWWPAIHRSVIVGDALYTISDAGVLRSDLASLADEGFVAFPRPDDAGRPVPIDIGAAEPSPAG